MRIFQESVIKNHIANLDENQVRIAYERFSRNYSNAKISKIKTLKEEEYQDGFLRDLFVDIFGYALKPDDNFNLVREFKNQTDGKKADGAILKDGKAVAVIELKSTITKDLTSITEQAFNYKNNQPDCKYIITSNFQKLRFYIDYSNEYEEFDLFNLEKDDFNLLYLILHKDSLLSDLPLKLKNETKFHEEKISDKLYKDYSNYKNKIFNNLVKNNPQYDKLTLFKKSQKFLDRLLFVFFAEDTGLVPPNAISKIIDQWQSLIDLDEYFTLYSRFVKFFEHLDKGHKYKTYDLPAYNGGLFAPDEILDNVIIDDEILKDDALLLSSYDFSTEVDVNILGHIFEHSLNEIEEITAEIEGVAKSSAKTKRKKDGVFYTPKYITQYIVENTVGKLCSEKREVLGLKEIEFDDSFKTKSGKLSAKGKALLAKLNGYKEWLKQLKIIDPACGSGAFLNQALTFLIEEHKQIDDIIFELSGDALRLFDVDKAILENNLFGVDINEESVEIAKLSLWLRTAQKGRRLSNLSNNIKCGNSLIDDVEVAGDKAFNWEKEFPQVFNTEKITLSTEDVKNNKEPDYLALIEHNAKLAQEKAEQSAKFSQEAIKYSKKVYEYVQEQQSAVGEDSALYGVGKGGFDVVIGNPPWNSKISPSESTEIAKKYSLGAKNLNMFYVFFYLANKIVKENGIINLLVPEVIIKNSSYFELRDKIINRYNFISISDYGQFPGVASNTVAVCYQKSSPKGTTVIHKCKNSIDVKKNIDTSIYNQNPIKAFSFEIDNDKQSILTKVGDNLRLIKIAEIKRGIELGQITELVKCDECERHTEISTKYYSNRDANKCKHCSSVINIDNKFSISSRIKSNQYSVPCLSGREIGKYSINRFYYIIPNLEGLDYKEKIFSQKNLFLKRIATKPEATIIDDLTFSFNTIYSIFNIKNYNKEYLLSILNSSLISFYYELVYNLGMNLTTQITIEYLKQIPIKAATQKVQMPFVEKANNMLELNKNLQQKKTKFLNRITDNFEIDKITKKLSVFYDFDFKTFVSELKKKKIVLSLLQQDEWEEYFLAYKTEINTLQTEISKTDSEIDQMVYKLYELSDDEIAIVEGSV